MPPKRQKPGTAVAPPQNLYLYEERLATFQSTFNLHRRTSTVPGKQQQALTWPVPEIPIEKLAEAGFYYKPTLSNQDTCVCYLCDKSLDGWEEGDSPAEEHLRHAPYCGWAIINALMVDRRKGHKVKLLDPNGETMTNARRMTFGNWWPHEGKRGWVPTVEMMVAGGFHYSPSEEFADKAACAYCEVQLDGWEQNDNPWNEHYKRQPPTGCIFFTWTEGTTSNSKPSIPTTDEIAKNLGSALEKPRKRAPAGPKVGRKRANSNASTMSVAGGSRKKKEESAVPENAFDTQEEAVAKPRKREKAAPRVGRKRAGSNASVMSELEHGHVTSEQYDEIKPEPVTEKPKKRAPAAPRTGRKRAGSNASMMSEMDHGHTISQQYEDQQPEPVAEKPRKRAPAAPRTGRKRAGSNASVMSELDHGHGTSQPYEEPQPEPVAEKPRKRAPAAPRTGRKRAGSNASVMSEIEPGQPRYEPDSVAPADPPAEPQTRKRAPAAPRTRKRGGSVLNLIKNSPEAEEATAAAILADPAPESQPPVEIEEDERKPRKRAPAAAKPRKRGPSRTRSEKPTFAKPVEVATFGDKRTDEERMQQASSQTQSFLSQFIRPASKTPVLSRESSREVSPARSEVGASGMRMFADSFVEEAPPRPQVMRKIRKTPDLRPPVQEHEPPREPTPEPAFEPEPLPVSEPNKPTKRTKNATKTVSKRTSGRLKTRKQEVEESQNPYGEPEPTSQSGHLANHYTAPRSKPSVEPENALRPLRQDSDGGMVLFDGGHDTDTEVEDEMEAPPPAKKERTASVQSDGSLGKRKRAELQELEQESEKASEPKKHKVKESTRKEAPATSHRLKQRVERPDVEMNDLEGPGDGYHDSGISEMADSQSSRPAARAKSSKSALASEGSRHHHKEKAPVHVHYAEPEAELNSSADIRNSKEAPKPRTKGSKNTLLSSKAKSRKHKSPSPVYNLDSADDADAVITDVEPPKSQARSSKSSSSLSSERNRQRERKSPTPSSYQAEPRPATPPPKRMSLDEDDLPTPRAVSPMDEDLPAPLSDEVDMLVEQQIIHEASTAGLSPSPQRTPQRTPHRSFHREGSVVIHPDSLPLHRSSSSPLKQENSPRPLRKLTSSPLSNQPILAPPPRLQVTPPYHTPEPIRDSTPTPTIRQEDLPWTLIDLDAFLDEVEDSTDIDNFDLSNTNTENIDALLSTEERDLTVQEWVKRNALLAEKRLLEVSERMVRVFEKEGRRALESLENGIEVN